MLSPWRVMVLVAALPIFGAEPGRQHGSSDYTIGPSVQPMVIYGEGWSQQFTIINVDYDQGGHTTSGTLRFFTRTGAPWKIPIKGVGTVDQLPVTLTSGQMVMFETEVSQQVQALGWAWLDLPVTSLWGNYHAFTTYRKQTPGALDLMTAVPFVDDLERQWIIPFDNTGGKYPGVGLVNNDNRAETFTLEAYSVSGGLLKSATRSVAPQNLDWFSLLVDYPELAGVAGQIKVKYSGLRGTAFSLQFAPNGAFTALPMVHTYGR